MGEKNQKLHDYIFSHKLVVEKGSLFDVYKLCGKTQLIVNDINNYYIFINIKYKKSNFVV